MAHKVAHYAIAVFLRVLLHRCTNVRNVVSRARELQRFKKAFTRNFDQLLHRFRYIADQNRTCRISVEPFELCTHIQTQDVAIPELIFTGDAVHHLLVHRRADALGIAAVIQEGRIGSFASDICLSHPVELIRRHADSSLFGKQIQGFLYDVARSFHLFNVSRVLNRDTPHHTSFSVRAKISVRTVSGVLSPSTVRSNPFAL